MQIALVCLLFLFALGCPAVPLLRSFASESIFLQVKPYLYKVLFGLIALLSTSMAMQSPFAE